MPAEEAEGLGQFVGGKLDRDEAAGAGEVTTKEPVVELRSDFSETAFWQPHLLLDEDGRLTARSSQAFLAYLEREQQ